MTHTTIKVRLIPNREQERLLRCHAGTHRYAYNFAKSYSEEYYKANSKGISSYEIAKMFRHGYNNIPWIKDICKDVSNVAISDYGKARDNSFKNHKDGYHTRYKSRKDLTQGFAVDARKLKFRGKVYLPKIGWLSVNKTPKKRLYKNPRVVFDGLYWHLTLGMEITPEPVDLTEEVLGVDLGLKNLAYISDGSVYPNINKTKTVRKLEKKRKACQRQMSRRVKDSKNYFRAKREHLKVCRRLTNIRDNHLHQVSSALVKTKPKAIVLEDLQIRNLLKNRRLSRAIQNASWYKLRFYITYKAERQGTEVVLAPTSFPSSQLCSSCHERFDTVAQKRTWGLDIRNWRCTHCGETHDRDLNAALNLKWYYNSK